MPDSIVIAPIEEALNYHRLKHEVGSKLNAEQWGEAVPVQIRETSQASATVESANLLQRIQDGITEILSHWRNELGGLTDRGAFMRDLTDIATREGLRPKPGTSKWGKLTDVGSVERTELIYTMQVGSAYGFAQWQFGMDSDALYMYPAQELVRIKESLKKRDWETRWAEAGAAVGWRGAVQHPKVALKTSPIWRKLSRFQRDFPPFDFNSGMWVEDIRRAEAIRLGLLDEGDRMKPQDKPYAEHWETSVANLGNELKDSLREAFPDRVRIVGDVAKWRK